MKTVEINGNTKIYKNFLEIGANFPLNSLKSLTDGLERDYMISDYPELTMQFWDFYFSNEYTLPSFSIFEEFINTKHPNYTSHRYILQSYIDDIHAFYLASLLKLNGYDIYYNAAFRSVYKFDFLLTYQGQEFAVILFADDDDEYISKKKNKYSKIPSQYIPISFSNFSPYNDSKNLETIGMILELEIYELI